MDSQSYYYQKIYSKINRNRLRGLMSLIVQADGQKILDIGCGSGLLGEAVKQENNAIIHGIDVSSKVLKLAEKRLDRVFCFDIQLPWESWSAEIKQNRYDKIILSEVLEHLFFHEKLLSQLKSISHQDTEIIITVPNLLFWKNRLKIFFGKFDYTSEGLMDKGHIHFFTWKSLKQTLQDAGYKILTTRNYYPTRGTKLIGDLFPGLFAYQFILKVRNNE